MRGSGLARIGGFWVAVLLAVRAWGGPFSQVPRSHWAYVAMARLQDAGLLDAPDFRPPTERTRYEFSLGLQRVLQHLNTLADQAEDRKGQSLASSGRWVTLAELQALLGDIERMVREFEDALEGGGIGPERVRSLRLRLLGNLSTLEWRERRLEVRSPPVDSSPSPSFSAVRLTGRASPGLTSLDGREDVHFTPVSLLLSPDSGLVGTLTIAPPQGPEGRLGWGAGASLPLGSWGEAEVGYRSGDDLEAEGILGARLRLNVAGLRMDLGYAGLNVKGVPFHRTPRLLTARLQHQREGLTLNADYRWISPGSADEQETWLPERWSTDGFSAFSGGLSYVGPRLALSYQHEQHLSVADPGSLWGRNLASLAYYAHQGLALQLQYERVRGDWARWQQQEIALLSAGVQWQVSPQVEFRLLHRLPTAARSVRRLGSAEGVTFSELAVHF